MNARRPITDSLQDRLWAMCTHHRAIELPSLQDDATSAGSISGSMAWPKACGALADGHISSKQFRRLRAVMEVVETLGPCEGRHHARTIKSSGNGDWLSRPEILSAAAWGNPLRWPTFLLDTPHPIASTSLRYLSHALWLKGQGMVGENSHVVEIGVGYGGLSAMNALVSQAVTTLVDLPEVERAAMTMLTENGVAQSARLSSKSCTDDHVDCVISNYAFTELSSELQDHMLATYIASSRHGMILSNASVFAHHIGGRSDDALLAALSNQGINARIHTNHPLLSPSDRALGNTLITW